MFFKSCLKLHTIRMMKNINNAVIQKFHKASLHKYTPKKENPVLQSLKDKTFWSSIDQISIGTYKLYHKYFFLILNPYENKSCSGCFSLLVQLNYTMFQILCDTIVIILLYYKILSTKKMLSHAQNNLSSLTSLLFLPLSWNCRINPHRTRLWNIQDVHFIRAPRDISVLNSL